MEHYGDCGSVFDIILLLYLHVAFCTAWGLVVFGLAGFVLACMGKYSWKSLGVLMAAILIGFLFCVQRNGEAFLYCIGCSPIVGLVMYAIERKRKENLQ